jgi:hypothetical protein
MKILEDAVAGLTLSEDFNLKFYHICKQGLLKSKEGEWLLVLQEDAVLPQPWELYREEFDSELLGKSYCVSPQLLAKVGS